MPSLIFPYSYHKGRSLPIIPIGIKGKSSSWWKINAYLDSGAFYSIFDAAVADLLDLSLMAGKKRIAVVGDGDTIPFYLHEIFLQVGSEKFSMEIGFSKQLKIGFNILGLDLFDRYEVTFKNDQRVVCLRKYS